MTEEQQRQEDEAWEKAEELAKEIIAKFEALPPDQKLKFAKWFAKSLNPEKG